jgi:hypothetical protein
MREHPDYSRTREAICLTYIAQFCSSGREKRANVVNTDYFERTLRTCDRDCNWELFSLAQFARAWPRQGLADKRLWSWIHPLSRVCL